MYLDFFSFREKPFNLTPDPRFVFLSKHHKETFAHLLYGINNRVGFIALTGEVGSGKTTVLRALLSQLDADHHRTALIFNPCLSPTELLQNINREFGILPDTSNNSSLLEALNQFLLQQNSEGLTVVLAIDEAQNLEAKVLEQVRLISNLETDREKLIQIVLAGQSELVQILKKKEMRQLSQRITVRYHLQPMNFEDTVEYINHRIEVAGGKGKVIFSRGAQWRIYKYSRGFPRLINAACDRALLAGYTRDAGKITSRIAAIGIRDLKRNMAAPYRKRRLILIPGVVMLAALLAAAVYLSGPHWINQFNASQPVEAIEKQVKKYPIAPREDLLQVMATELGKIPEADSGRRAFNTLAGLWNVPPVPENENLTFFNGMESAARSRELHLYRFSGSLGELLHLDVPAALELNLPGVPGKRFVLLVGRDKERLLLDPPVAGRKSLSFGELEKHWSGKGFLFWKDPLNLLAGIFRGSHIKELQELLREAGAYKGPLTGVYDDATISAVKEFQSSKGIKQDGIVGDQTLLHLYCSIDRFGTPRLTAGKK